MSAAVTGTLIAIELAIPPTPTHLLHLPGQPGRRQDGFKEAPKIDIADVSDNTLYEIGQRWTRDLINKAAARRQPR